MINESGNDTEEQLNPTPQEQLTSIQDRILSLENQIHEIELDLPQNVSKSILNMRNDIQILIEKSNSQSDQEAPYVYSESLEKIGDFQRRIEWKVKDFIQNKMLDADSQLEENCESSRAEEKSETSSPDLHNTITESLEKLRLNTGKIYEEDKKSLNELEEQLIQIGYQAKTATNSPSRITSHISNEIILQQKQINELERTLNSLPNLIFNSRRLTEKFSNASEPKEKDDQNENKNNKIFDKNVPDLTIPFSTLESEVQTTISSLQIDLENILKRIEIVDKKLDENEQQIEKITNSQGKAAEILSDVEDKSVSMMDSADDFSSKLSENLDLSPLEEMEKETQKKIRIFKKEIAEFQSAVSKKENQIAQNNFSST